MTIHEVSSQIYFLTRESGHTINGGKRTKKWLDNYLTDWLRPECGTKRLVMAVGLADGDWTCVVNRYADGPDGFDYWIPDTREQEASFEAEWLAGIDSQAEGEADLSAIRGERK